jgi:NAD(P)-dependent dehydrogenase (short-subunit alcohol dehydrogenase family)
VAASEHSVDGFARLDGGVALVTGAGSGIGRAAAVELSKAGASVIVTSRSEASARATAALIAAAQGCECTVMPFDVTSSGERRAVVDHVAAAYGRLDVLVANAGIDLSHEPSVEQLTQQEWDSVLETNLSSVFRLVQALLPLMGDGGSIVTIGSANSLVARKKAAAYVASKGGLLLLTRALAIDLTARGIRANCVCPGNIDTPLTDRFLDASGQSERLRADYAAAAPLQRLGTPEEVASCIRFLASRAASFVTGSALVVDGGLTAI